MHTLFLNHVMGQAFTSQVDASQTSLHPCSMGHPLGIQSNYPYAQKNSTNFCINLIGAKWSHLNIIQGTLCQDK
jgi:hypothetical protein